MDALLLRPSWLNPPRKAPEPSVLTDTELSAWAGLRLSIFQAQSVELRGQQGEHPAVAMILTGRTRARITSRGQTCDFCPGPESVGLFAPMLDVAWTRWDCEPGAERLVIELDPGTLERRDGIDTVLPPRRRLKQDLTLRDPQLAALLRLMADEVRGGSPHGALYAESLSVGLMTYLYADHGVGGTWPAARRSMLTAAQRAHVLDTVEARFGDDLSIGDLAAAAGVSRFHFIRLFKHTFGMTPYRFVLARRLAAACQLLEQTELALAEIAFTTGFGSQSHLSGAMRRELGKAPGEWRRSARGPKVPRETS
jgi:AraC family transcriptional regulator